MLTQGESPDCFWNGMKESFREREEGFMLNFIKFLAEGRGLRDHKGLIWSHNPFPFDYQLLIEALNWSLLNMAAREVALAELSDLTGSVTGLKKRWQISSRADPGCPQ